MSSSSENSKIAIIGMSCRFPGANSLKEYWENILAKRRQFRLLPDRRLSLSQYYDPEASDKINGKYAALIDGFRFNWLARRIPKTAFESADIVHWLALEVALEALQDAGYSIDSVSDKSCGVIVGNTLTGELTRAVSLRFRWPYVRKAFRASAMAREILEDLPEDFEETFETFYKSVFPPMTEDCVTGSLSNTIAGRICNYLDIDGGGYTVDGACSSSLLALATAGEALLRQDLELALVGGVDVSIDPFELVGFSRAGALEPDELHVFDMRAGGLMPGEGCGFVVLKRLEDARRDENRIYAVLKGWGISSDGQGGLLSPKAEGQAKAIMRAFEKSGVKPQDLAFIEGHGTGTKLGDPTELRAVSIAFENYKVLYERMCGITSVKSIIGHTKAAAGIAGLIKAIIAVNRRVLPPLAGCKYPHPEFKESATYLYPILQGEVLEPKKKIQAGVSAMGFGGINCHAVIESEDPPFPELNPSIEEKMLFVSSQDAELFLLSADSLQDMLQKIDYTIKDADDLSFAEIADLAAKMAGEVEGEQSVRAAVTAGTPKDLLERLEFLKEKIQDNFPEEGKIVSFPHNGVWIGNSLKNLRIGFLFPGQGSQKLNMARTIVERHKWGRRLLNKANEWIGKKGPWELGELIYRPTDHVANSLTIKSWEKRLAQTKITQPAICLASILWLQYLKRLDINPVAVGGHSLGESTAFHAAGAFDQKTLISLAATRGRAMSAPAGETGEMLSLRCSREEAESILQSVGNYAVIANINSPRQIVISGSPEGIREVIEIAGNMKIPAVKLMVSNAFHSKFVADASLFLRKNAPIPEFPEALQIKLFSTKDGRQVEQNINLHEHFSQDVVRQVDFVSMIKEMSKECDMFVEVGPGNVLSNLVNEINGKNGPHCFPVESSPGSDLDFNAFLANYFIRGGRINNKGLYENRLIRPFVPAANKLFIENPCEKPFPSSLLNKDMKDLNRDGKIASKSTAGGAEEEKSVQDILKELVEDRTGFPQNILFPDTHLINDLNLNSIKVGEIIVETADRMGIRDRIDPTALTNLTLESISETIQTISREKAFTGDGRVDVGTSPWKYRGESWVRNFVIEYTEEKPPVIDSIQDDMWNNTRVSIVCEPQDNSFAEAIKQELSGMGAIVEVSAFSDLREESNVTENDFTHRIAILPSKRDDKDLSHEEQLKNAIKRLRLITPPPSSTPDDRKGTLTYIQFGEGYFGTRPGNRGDIGIEQCCSNSYASSVSFERKKLKVRVLDFSPEVEPTVLAGKVILELSTPEDFSAIGYDSNLVRRIPAIRPKQPVEFKSRNISWTDEDVIIVTGGAKGITAECALAFAENTGVKMALIGSSPAPEDISRTKSDSKIISTLKRFESKGIECRYYSCDIGSYDAVEKVIQTVQAELGSVTGVIHGAALNMPGRVELTWLGSAFHEVKPKVLGIFNICKALENSPLKLIVGFTSSSGIFGTHGNTWYSFSNEALDIILRRYGEKHPETSVISIAWSLWSEIGMGDRMGIVRQRESQGIGAITTDKGISRFLSLVENDPGERQVMVSGRLGDIINTRLKKMFPPPRLRFLEDIIEIVPGVEVISKAHVNLDKDLYMRDHHFEGSYIFPAVFGLEAMAQVIKYLIGCSDFGRIRIENVWFNLPIMVDFLNGVDIEIQALIPESESKDDEVRISASIRPGNIATTKDYFSAEFIFYPISEPPREPIEIPANVDSIKNVYENALFPGPVFHRVKEIYPINNQECTFTVGILPAPEEMKVYQEGIPVDFVLGNPFFRDTLLQVTQISRVIEAAASNSKPWSMAVPLNIGSMDIYKTHNFTSQYIMGQSILTDVNPNLFTILTVDENGSLVEKIQKYQAYTIKHKPEEYLTTSAPTKPDQQDYQFFKTELLTKSRSLGISPPEVTITGIKGIHAMSKEERHEIETSIIRETLKNSGVKLWNEVKIDFTDSGKPVLIGEDEGKYHVSISHTDRVLLCSFGQNPQGCDIEEITQRSVKEWKNLLGSSHIALFEQLQAEGDQINMAGTRIWSALEALYKVGMNKEIKIESRQHKGNSILFRGISGKETMLILSFPVNLNHPLEYIISLIVLPDDSMSTGAVLLSDYGYDINLNSMDAFMDKEREQIVFTTRFSPGMRGNANPGGSVHFTNFFKWIGQIQETISQPIISEIIEHLSSNKLGIATNYCRTQFVGEAHNEIIEAQFRIGGLTGPNNSTVTLYFDWHKILPHGERERLAFSEQRITMSSIMDKDLLKSHPMPDFLLYFIGERLPKKDAPYQMEPMKESLSEISLGNELFIAGEDQNAMPIVFEKTFETTYEDSNLMGNIYFSNYFIWQSRIIDQYFNKVEPDYSPGPDNKGELLCLDSSVEYLRHAEPFDKILVTMSLKYLYEQAVKFHFEYFQVDPAGKKEKIAFGDNEVLWVEHNNLGEVIQKNLPKKIIKSLTALIGDDTLATTTGRENPIRKLKKFFHRFLK